MEVDLYLRFVAALVFVLGLIGLLAWLARRFGLPGRMPAPSGPDRRLDVVEVRALDTKHRLVLLRRDSIEHLVLLGPAGDLLIETGIRAPGTAAAKPPQGKAGT